ncbi:MAG: hypothetical protein L6R37_005306 [Teloschistes peruensis]|nr:MAG: hypothetical protein L6R37_005306 [Teloschistes peruensis]
MNASILPEELLASLNASIQCRQLQIQQTACLLASDFPSPPTLVLHGPEATGKTLTINALLEAIDTSSAIVRSKECITTRHLLERTLTEVQKGLGDTVRSVDGRCESISAFVVQLQRLLEGQKKYILVFDNIDRQREAAPTLLPALARLGQVIPDLTIIFIVTHPQPSQFHMTGILHINFPSYTRADLLALVSASPLPLDPPTDSTLTFTSSDLSYLYPRFATAVHDSLAQPTRNSLPAFRTLCARIWPSFIAPVLAGHYGPREFSKLMVCNRHLFQSEDALRESIIKPSSLQQQKQQNQPHPPSTKPTTKPKHQQQQQQPLHLPPLPAQLLITAYLATHTPPKHDFLLFSKHSLSSSSRRRRRRGKTNPTTNTTNTPKKTTTSLKQRRKISRTLLGGQPFGLERLFAIWNALFHDAAGKGGVGAEALVQFATVVGMGLVARVGGGAGGGGGDPLEGGGGKWRCVVGRDHVRSLARGLKLELDDYLLD